jgi:hypothetical protein
VFLDAFVPDDGDAMPDLTGAAVIDAIRAAQRNGEPGVPPRPAAAFSVNERDRAWVDSLTGPQPIGTFTEKIALAGARERIARKAYIRAKNYANPGFDKALARLKGNPAWRIYQAPCGHDVMVDMPERLAEILEEVA